MSDTGGIAYIVDNPLGLSFNSDEFEAISRVAKSKGLNSDHLSIVCSWIESEEIDEKFKLELIECLIPEASHGTIPEDVCIRLSYLLKIPETSMIIKVELLKWMICAHSFMELDGRWQMLYEMFLGILKDKEMSPYAGHFLYLITKKKHVTYRRVKSIFRFISEHGDLPFFKLILQGFFFHAPEYFEDELEDPLCEFEPLGAYASLIKKVRCTYKPNFSNILITTTASCSTAMFSEFDTMSDKVSSVSAPILNPFQQLYKQYRVLERSTNISDILRSKFKYLFLTSRLKTAMQTKIQDYIISSLHNDYDSEDITEIYSEFFRLKRSFPGMSEFTEFLLIKNDCHPDTAEALCFEPVCCFKKIQYKLQLIKGKFLTTDDIELKCQWLNSLSKMFCYWILQIRKSIPCDGSCNEKDSDASDTPICHVPSTEIRQLGSEIDFLCDSLIMEDSSPFVLYQILQHYQMGAIARMQKGDFILCFPPPSVFQLSLFSLNPILLEALCGFILRINKIHSSQAHPLKHEEVMMFHASCNDIKKVVWGGSYKTESTYLAKTETFKKLIKMSSEFKNAFILHKHPALFLITLEFTEKYDPKSILINHEIKQEFYSHLAKNGCKDFLRLIHRIK